MKRVFSVLLCLMLFLTSSASALETRDSMYFNGYGATLSATGGGKITITFSCDSVGTADQLGVSSFSIFRYDGANWNLISGPHSGGYAYNTNSYSSGRTFYGASGEKYRVQAVFGCGKGGTFETKNYTSGSIVAR